MVGIGGALEPGQPFGLILSHANAIEQHLAEDGLRLDQAHFGRRADPGGILRRRPGAQGGQLLGRGRGHFGRRKACLHAGVVLAWRHKRARLRASASPTSVGSRRTLQDAMSTVRRPA